MRLNNDALAALQLTASQCPGHDGANSAESEGSIDKQTRFSIITLWLHGRQLCGERVLQIFNPFASADRRGNDRRARKWCLAQSIANLRSDDVDPAQIAFRKRNHGMLYSEIRQNLQMFLALRHPAVIRGDDKQRDID